MSGLTDHFVELPHVDWKDGRPFAISRLSSKYASLLEDLALSKENVIKALPVAPGWERFVEKNPTTARYSSYSVFHLSPNTLPLFFAIRETYLHLLGALGQNTAPRFIQCWYNIHRAGESLGRHKHPYSFIGTFSAHAEGSETRYGNTKETSESDLIVKHVAGQLMVTTGAEHYHETSVWGDASRARVTYAFDILDAERWNPRQVFLPFDS